ncbi:DUF5682 family protein [Adhaeretor mobilis]|uniref:Uncharacterized protein n=1 Tax=Adhaeretor mobilis TaxID=1930276 RepID=A0A517MWF3_9BACT|nr:DUF5682 family protein [Adhaeretor mobilis]QDS99210.1 hypothetical protein HG15A2_25020 [Adhaeretor mobilis]
MPKTTETMVPTFGVRHLSPMGAWQLRRFLDEVQPRVVLVEGLEDATYLISDIVRKGTQPPIAILAYTQEVPVRTLVYPLAKYSPEYQAIAWSKENKARVEFFDLPSDKFLALQANEEERRLAELQAEIAAEEEEGERRPDEPPVEDANGETLGDNSAPEASWAMYARMAELVGEHDYESYWERNFEHNGAADAYRQSSFEFGRGLRECDSREPFFHAENLVREAYMRRRIQHVLASGCPAEKVVAIVGAFHAPVLNDGEPAMTDSELESLSSLASKLTLMPYSYFKLSSQSGYGAGNRAPAYFELLWEAIEADELSQLPARYLSLVTRHLRKAGTSRSTAEVIEGVRLAKTLSALKEGLAPTLRDLQDAAITLIGHGERSVVQESLARVEVGTAIGRLPKGVSQTSIQEDFDRELERLKLTKYREGVKQELALDLRENRRAKTEAAAFLDLSRSSFLNRLSLLEVSFAAPQPDKQESTTWRERWHLHWTPGAEIGLVEAVLLGETVELAAAFKFKTELEKCTTIGAAGSMVRLACECGMMRAMDQARGVLQRLSADTSAFPSIAQAAQELSVVVRYGDVRQFDPKPLVPLIEALFVQGTLGLFHATNCGNDAAKPIASGMDALNKVALEYHDQVDEPAWIAQLHNLSDADDHNPLLSGYACAILLERNEITNEQLGREVSRRLSPGIEADLGAGWFEGLSGRNRYALLARQVLWEQLADYVKSLDDEQFSRALVFLRRAFGSFSPQEKRSISENLGECWGVGGDLTSEVLSQPLLEDEEQAIDDLNEFDFDDL